MAGKRFDGFGAFVDVYLASCECLREPQDVHRLMLEVAEDAKISGAAWIEVAPSFSFYAQRFGGPFETLKLLAEAAQNAETLTGVGIGLVVSIERQLGTNASKDLARLVQRAASKITICDRPAVVGFGLHGPEEGKKEILHCPQSLQTASCRGRQTLTTSSCFAVRISARTVSTSL